MTALTSPDIDQELLPELTPSVMKPWQLLVWDDPVNLMSYVVRVFMSYFGYGRERATALMLQVHHAGHSVVAEGPREQMELHAQAMHDRGLWATVREVPA